MNWILIAESVENGDSLGEDNIPISFNIYSNICELFFKDNDYEYLFAHIFSMI